MASQVLSSTALPTNFYLRNPLALLVAKHHLVASTDLGAANTKLKRGSDASTKTTKETRTAERSDVGQSFVADGTAVLESILDLAEMLDASQHVANGGNDRLDGKEMGEKVGPSIST